MTGRKHLELGIHGFYPTEIVDGGVLGELVRQVWEMGGGIQFMATKEIAESALAAFVEVI